MENEEYIKEPYFLVTTALEEFWDTSKPLLYLGVWCRRYCRRSYWEPLGGTIIKGPWTNVGALEQTGEYLNDKYEYLLAALTNALNRLHKTDHGERYWRILLGPWLQLYVPIMYDRLKYIQAALDSYPDLTTIVLDENSFVIPRDTYEFFKLSSDDPYNLQLYSRILKVLGKEYPSKSTDVSLPDIICPRPTFLIGLMMALKPVLNVVTSYFRKRASVLLRESYFPLSVEMQIVLKSKGRIFPLLAKQNINSEKSSLRSYLTVTDEAKDKFEELLLANVALDIPKCYIEDYQPFSIFADSNHSHKTKAVFSSISWYYDESFKFFAATSTEKGIALFSAQHGGAYGSLLFHSGEKHEISISDRYYSWGWDEPNNKKIIAMPAAKLSNRFETKADDSKDGILFVSTTYPRYLIQFPGDPESFLEYLSWQTRFIQACSEATISKLRVRFRWDDSGWDIKQRWKDIIPSLCEDSFDVPLATSLEKHRLFVSDNLQTTFLEALSANIPTILFWDAEMNKLRPEAKPYYEKLINAGILYHCPESAAHAISAVYDDVEKWWNEPTRQEARYIFCQRFARTFPDSVDYWNQEFEKVLNDLIVSESTCMPSNV